jgi:Zn-finger nucleic acid-binding protein
VWLDRGELDKIVERSDAYVERPTYGERLSYRKKRKSFFSELFDD